MRAEVSDQGRTIAYCSSDQRYAVPSNDQTSVASVWFHPSGSPPSHNGFRHRFYPPWRFCNPPLHWPTTADPSASVSAWFWATYCHWSVENATLSLRLVKEEGNSVDLQGMRCSRRLSICTRSLQDSEASAVVLGFEQRWSFIHDHCVLSYLIKSYYVKKEFAWVFVL